MNSLAHGMKFWHRGRHLNNTTLVNLLGTSHGYVARLRKEYRYQRKWTYKGKGVPFTCKTNEHYEIDMKGKRLFRGSFKGAMKCLDNLLQ